MNPDVVYPDVAAKPDRPQTDAAPAAEKLDAATVEMIRRSKLFDVDFYNAARGTDFTVEQAIADYLDSGENAGFAPSNLFEPAFYREINVDVAKLPINVLRHYVAYGRVEGRYATRAALRRNVDLLRRTQQVKLRSMAEANAPSITPGFTVLEGYLNGHWRAKLQLVTGFDDLFYHRTYEDVRSSGLPPIIHYLERGREEGRVMRAEQLEPLLAPLREAFDEPFYRSQRPKLSPDADALVDYMVYGRFAGFDPSPDFSAEAYLTRYPDVASAGVEPYTHYIQYGRFEDRQGDAASYNMEVGDRDHDPAKPTILVASHESSRTGAPLVALGVAEHLADTHNIILLTGKAGPLSVDFKAASTRVVTGIMGENGYERLLKVLRDADGLSGAVLNSVETFRISEGALHAGIPSVALIHEFAEYSDFRVRRMVGTADRAVFPARLLLASATKELLPIGEPTNAVVRHQGLLPSLPSDPDATDLTDEDIAMILGTGDDAQVKVVIGAGHVQIRKGVDIFVQTAAEVRKRYPGKFKFLWVGGGYDPVRDLNYSLYVRETVDRLGLQDVVHFVPAQASLDRLLAKSDAFYLSSRMDPFPNVALDAWEAELPVICFDQGTGVAEEIAAGRAIGAAVAYGDVVEAADALIAAFGTPPGYATANARLVEEHFKFTDYADFLGRELTRAEAFRDEAKEIVGRIEDAEAFDAQFHEAARTSIGLGLRPLRHYVVRAMKGLSVHNPRPGFSDNVYRSRHGIDQASGVVPLAHALDAGETRPTTHECMILGEGTPAAVFKGSAVLHLHLHYADLAFDFARRLANSVREIDILVTTGSEKKKREIEYAFNGYRRGTVKVVIVPNRGRDMGPLLAALPELIRKGGYDLVGHLHGKKSLTAFNEPTATGDRWRSHMVNLLLGDGRRLEHVLGMFADPKTGLVFPEDRNAVGWTENLELARTLATRMTPRPKLPRYPYYPLGAMFWARRAVLEPLFDLKLGFADFPPEPLPYDGTVLHTVERMLPAVCESVGLEWKTVHVHGAGW